jgi:DNA-binding transcriptional LysR family regulator
MELRHLRYFVAVAEELHFSRAAERVGIAQPPFSQQIKHLETEVGTQLLSRTKRRVELTAAGKVFLEEARKTLAQAEQALQMTRRAARGDVGQLSVGFVSSAVYGKFASIFGLMRARHPDVALVLQDLTSEEQYEAITAHRLDIGLVRPPTFHAEGFESRVVLREPLMLVLQEGHPLAGKKRISLAALAHEPFLLVPRQLGPAFYDQVVGMCATAGFVPRVIQEARSTQTIVSLIAGGMGVSIVPASMQSLQRVGVVYRPLQPPVSTTDLAVLWRKNDLSPVLASFLKIVWEVAGMTNHPATPNAAV